MISRLRDAVGAVSRRWRALDSDHAEVLAGATTTFLLKVTGSGASFGLSVLVARLFGADRAGLFFLALTVGGIASVAGRAGLDNALLRLVASEAVHGLWDSVRGVYRTGMRVAFATSLTTGVLLFLLASWLSTTVFSKPDIRGPLIWMAVAVVPTVLSILHGEVLKGLKRIFASQVVQGAAIPVTALVACAWIGTRFGVVGAIWAYTAGTFVAAALGWAAWQRAMRDRDPGVSPYSLASLLDSSTPLFWVASANLILNWTAVLLLGIWGTSRSVGVFSAASRTAMLISFVLVPVNSIAAPKIAEMFSARDLPGLRRIVRYSATLVTVFALPAIVLFVAAPSVMLGLFGREFVAGTALLRILAAGQFINVLTGPVGFVLMMCGRERVMRNIAVVVSGLNIVLNVVLIRLAGSIGAAVATAIAVAAINVCGAVVAYRQLGVVSLPTWPVRRAKAA